MARGSSPKLQGVEDGTFKKPNSKHSVDDQLTSHSGAQVRSSIFPSRLPPLTIEFSDSYKEWCMRNGKHSTPTYPDVDWNASLIWKMRMELDFQWDILEDEVAEIFGKLSDNLGLELTWLRDDTVMRKPFLLVQCSRD